MSQEKPGCSKERVKRAEGESGRARRSQEKAGGASKSQVEPGRPGGGREEAKGARQWLSLGNWFLRTHFFANIS